MGRKIWNHQKFLKELNKKQPNFSRYYKILSDYNGYTNKILVKSKFNKHLITSSELLIGSKPNIVNAVNKEEYLLNKIKQKYPNLNLKLNSKSKYLGYNIPIILETEIDEICIRPDKLLEGSKPNINHATNKNSYFYNYLQLKQPHYFNYNFQLLSNYIKNNIPIKFEFNGEIYKRLPLSLLQGTFTGKRSLGVYNKTIIERKKVEFLNKDCILYVIQLYDINEIFYKIGICTIDLEKRLNNIPYNYKIINLIKDNLYHNFYKEQKYQDILKNEKYTPEVKFGGYQECYKNISKILNNKL